ncbi:MAG: cytochrome c oxidase accessory protein CcoG [Gammaproteobacteria bacterium]|nr:cytochrome c oxidase accessory protein CcoG [Gammaproteobacteria bacterium]NIR58772.1 cytochrome c oxidase accessory protein CcoG [Gammaproteobacteria bacterium]NIV73804.1 cytochrome c oxidase accessory protein CcoG [Gammaproteobacteria bacterium]
MDAAKAKPTNATYDVGGDAAERRRGPRPREAVEAQKVEFYAKREKIYPRQVHGWFRRLRVTGVLVLLGTYYLLPWVPWQGRQAVLFDLPARKFYIFDWVFWPQDVFYLALLLIIAAYALFFFTTLAGRLWCGYACPQTVWTEVFLWMERLVEGGRSKRMKLDRARWGHRKLAKKSLKHALWLAFAFWTGFTFVGYFTPITELTGKVAVLALGPWETFWIFFYGLATWGNAGFLREQVCIYMCPYARFQGAMFDNDTLVISYDEARGEPRGPRQRGVDPRALGLGDCVGCTLCVQVCPTGIDIRDGLQYQCIGCAACIDVCDEVMEKVGYPKGLIRYTTENALRGQSTRVLRPRVLIYGALLIVLVGALLVALAVRTPLELDVLRDRNALYRETSRGLVENVYRVKIINMDQAAHDYRLELEGLPHARLMHAYGETVSVAAGEVLEVPVQVRIDPVHLEQGGTEIRFRIEAVDRADLVDAAESRFIGPAMR